MIYDTGPSIYIFSRQKRIPTYQPLRNPEIMVDRERFFIIFKSHKYPDPNINSGRFLDVQISFTGQLAFLHTFYCYYLPYTQNVRTFVNNDFCKHFNPSVLWSSYDL